MDFKEKFRRIIKSRSGVLYIEGKPGTGKTSIVEAIANEEDWQFIDVRLAQKDSGEVLGIPKEKKITINGVEISVTTYALQEEFVLANTKPTLIFFDELNRAPLMVRNAALSILLEHRIGTFRFNQNVYFATAGNIGDEDGCEVEDFDAALRDRLVPVRYELTFDEWNRNFADQNVNPNIISFLKSNPSYFYKVNPEDFRGATPRSWTFFSNFVGKDAKPNEILNDIDEYGSFYVGTAVTRFKKYLEDLKVVTINDILNRFDEVEEYVKTAKRDKISEWLTELKEKDIQKLKKVQVENILKFINHIDDDEVVSFFKMLASKVTNELEGNILYLFKAKKEFLSSIKNMLTTN